MTRRHWRRLLVPTCLLTMTTLSACSDITGPRKTVDLSEWGACFLCGGPGPHPGIQTPALLDTTPPSTEPHVITVEVRRDGQ